MKLREVVSARSFDLRYSGKVIYSVSLAPNSSRLQMIVDGYRWATTQFDDVAVYLGDGRLLEITLRVRGCSPDNAAHEASAIARDTLEQLERVATPTAVLSMSSISTTEDFRKALMDVRLFCAREPELRRSIESDAADYVARIQRRGDLATNVKLANNLACDYIDYEIAGYLTLARAGYLVDVYATGSSELPTLARFIHGELTGFPELAERKCLILGRKK